MARSLAIRPMAARRSTCSTDLHAVRIARRLIQITRDVDVDRGTVYEGGTIFFSGGRVDVTGCTIVGNRSGYATRGGIYADDGSRVTITGSTVTRNHAPYNHCGGIAGGSDVTLIVRDSVVSGNFANYGGIKTLTA